MVKLPDHFNEFFNVKDHWNIIPSVSYLSVTRNVGGNWSFGVVGSVNKITKYVVPTFVTPTSSAVVNPGDWMYYGLMVKLITV